MPCPASGRPRGAAWNKYGLPYVGGDCAAPPSGSFRRALPLSPDVVVTAGRLSSQRRSPDIRKTHRSRVDVVIVGEDVTRCLDLRQYVDNALCTAECGKHGPLEEIGGNIDAAEGNAVVERCRRSQALRAMVTRASPYNPMERDVVLAIHPEKVRLARVLTHIGNEAAGRRCTVRGRYGRQGSVPDSRNGIVADREAKERRGRAKDLPLAVEDKDFRIFLVDDDKRQAAVVRRGNHPV